MKDSPSPNGYFSEAACDPAEFRSVVERTLTPGDVPLAREIAKNIPLYDAADLGDGAQRQALMAEWAHVLMKGAGALVIRGAAWLGPNYQMTAQLNVVYPGGQAQQAHRDYHLGFQTSDMAARYPAHVHVLSPALTLQGGLAHCDMSLESGPTKLLPFSQAYAPGYVAWRCGADGEPVPNLQRVWAGDGKR